MLHDEFTARLKNFCLSLGFGKVKIRRLGFFSELDCTGLDGSQKSSGAGAVIILSCKVSYNPNWGGYRGLPQLFVRQQHNDRDEQSPAGFIAPFLRQYRFAQEHTYLTRTEQGQFLITLPTTFLKKESKLVIDFDKVVQPDEDGAIVPVTISGATASYRLSNSFRRTLDTLNSPWKTGRSIQIGRYLGSDLFSFADTGRVVDQTSPFCKTLLPSLGRIVTHPTPHLYAAEIHLRQEFSRAISAFTAENRSIFGNVLCLAGLDIDMAAFRGHEERYFVPWKAYLARIGEDSAEKYFMEQDDLFVRLMQQETCFDSGSSNSTRT